MQTVLAQATRKRGPEPTPVVVVVHPAEVMRAHLQPYLIPDDLAGLDLLQLDLDAVVQRLETDPGQGTCFALVRAMTRAYQEQLTR